nr:MAG TPA: hypothetical protein [Caudoviricetes sp.]
MDLRAKEVRSLHISKFTSCFFVLVLHLVCLGSLLSDSCSGNLYQEEQHRK